jgi:hypothetical protein
MKVAALIFWLITALGGFYLLGTWLSRGGIRQQQARTSRFPAPVIFGHFLLAAAPAATRAAGGAPAATATVTADVVPAERHLPVPVILAHGALAAATLVLVLLAAISV